MLLLHSAATCIDRRHHHARAAQGTPASYLVLAGYPPTAIEAAPASALSSSIRDGDTVTIRANTAVPAAMPSAPPARQASEASGPIPGAAVPEVAASVADGDERMQQALAAEEDEDLQQALAMSLMATAPATTPATGAAPAAHAVSMPAPPPPAAPSRGGGFDAGERMVRRVVPADGQCLFNSLAYTLEGGRAAAAGGAKVQALRERVADAVLEDTDTHNEARPNPCGRLEMRLTKALWFGLALCQRSPTPMKRDP